jgi:hypothetical protein
VVGMIRSCRAERSLQLVRNAITPWMAPSIMHRLVTSDSNRLTVVQAFVQCVPEPYFAEVRGFSSSIQILISAEIDANVRLHESVAAHEATLSIAITQLRYGCYCIVSIYILGMCVYIYIS